MTPGDLDRVAEIALIGFPDHFEDRACFANRLALWPRGCFVLDDGVGVIGYLISYPWMRALAPKLNAPIEAVPAAADVLYLHDLALHPEARGRGATGEIVERLATRAAADGWPAVALVAVNDASGFWCRHGFEVVEGAATASAQSSYGDDARYMERRLDA